MSDVTDAEVEAVARIFAGGESADRNPDDWSPWANYARTLITAVRAIEAPKPPVGGPVTLWLNYGCYEGWKPTEYPSVGAALLAEKYSNEFRITRDVAFETVEKP
jgi:hypothetical protein